MASWQPPIPSGALWSRPARDLGSALALLAWCYDAVQRDGCFDIQLKDVAAELDEPYRTVIKWWALVQQGPFFATITDRGRAGFHVQFNEDWIEWRILGTRGTRQSNRFQAQDLVTEEKCIKEDMSHESGVSGGSAPAATLGSEETAVTIYQRITGMTDLNTLQRESMANVHDLALWQATCEHWMLLGYKVRNLPGMLDNYAKRLTEQRQTQAKRAGYSAPRPTPEPYDYSQDDGPYSEAYQARLKASMRGAK